MSDSQGGSSPPSEIDLKRLDALLAQAQKEFEWAKGSLILRGRDVGQEVLALNRGLHSLRNARAHIPR